VARISPGDWPALPGLVEILNVHVQAPHAGLPWTAFGRRRAQVAALCRALADPGPGRRLLVGDLNATPLWPAYRRLVEHLPDVIHRHARERGEPPARTWGPWSGCPRLLRIDHVLGVGVRAVASEAVPLSGSDHSAVIVDLELAEAERQEP
jgi:endonuclease/exonuclease/phosphatase (EEP) superfamily protein YafD